jgi:NAD(P)-dependent dehydrogenase (short-subunit alcohol dehydrogenase family)
MRIGFLGLGNMGRAMASNLIRAGHELIVYNRSRNAAEALAMEGARIADDPAKAAGQEIVITMLANDNAVESVVLGAHGVLDGMQHDGLHVSMSTISPALSQRLSAAHKERGQQYLAAPVFGRPEALTAVNELRGIALADVLIRVDLTKFSGTDYNNTDQLIAQGYKAAQDCAAALLKFAMDDGAWQA